MMKTKLSKIIWILFLLIDSPILFATVDGGESSDLIGFMGKNQEYALVYYHSIEPEEYGHGKLFAISMTNRHNAKLDPVKVDINLENKSKIISSEEKKLYQAFSSYELNFDKKLLEQALYFFYLSKVNSKKYEIFQAAQFVKRYHAKIPHEKNSLNYHEKADSKAYFLISPHQKVMVYRQIVKKVEAIAYFDDQNNVECSEGFKKPLCDTCQSESILVNGQSEKYLSCSKKTGKTLETSILNDQRYKKGSPCQCHGLAYVIAPEILYKNLKIRGPEFFTYGKVIRGRRGYGAPGNFIYDGQIQNLALFQNKNGGLILTGSFTSTPTLNGTYYPIVAVHPGK